VIKICPECKSTWAGGRLCEDCGATLENPYGNDAEGWPAGVWSYIRLQYGARRGMLVRVLAFLLGPTVAFLLLREAVILAMPWSLLGSLCAVATGILVWLGLHVLAGRAVRIWVLRKGQVSQKKLARAMLRRARAALSRK
jgi:hypothetical protein